MASDSPICNCNSLFSGENYSKQQKNQRGPTEYSVSFPVRTVFPVSHPRCTSIWTEASAGCPKLQKLSPDDQQKKKKENNRESPESLRQH
jgi:hypothetical protein